MSADSHIRSLSPGFVQPHPRPAPQWHAGIAQWHAGKAEWSHGMVTQCGQRLPWFPICLVELHGNRDGEGRPEVKTRISFGRDRSNLGRV
ncbi:hypothetical protein BaRGS_00037644 [Batillaria attramentaria]|uniref:Uncharacterized protein n=1 Tax=Batillaria attramentaria TaxID=370345 RepID=A0ABD0J8B4_9CAEN